VSNCFAVSELFPIFAPAILQNQNRCKIFNNMADYYFCPKCHKELYDGLSSCRSCGEKMPAIWADPYCPNCGEQLNWKNGGWYCEKCRRYAEDVYFIEEE